MHCGPSFSKQRKSLKSSPVEKFETTLSPWFQQACAANVSIDGTLLKEKALHVAKQLGIDNFRASNSWIDHFKKQHNLVYKTVSGESASVNPLTVMDWKNEELPKVLNGYHPKDVFNVDETGLFYFLQPNKAKFKQIVTVLLGCNDNGTEKLPPLVIGRYKNPHCFRNCENTSPQIHSQLQPIDDFGHF